MKKHIKHHITILVSLLMIGNLCSVKAYAQTNSSIGQNKDNTNATEAYSTSKTSDTFDVKTVIPEIAVIVVATGVLLFCITNKS